MKKLLFLLLAAPLASFGQRAGEQIIKSEVRKVRLFLTSGEMTHEAAVKVVKGRNKIVFSGISAYADPQSIQFTAPGDYRIVSQSTEIDFLAAEQYNPTIRTLKDSLGLLKDRHQENADMIGAYNAELALMNTNKDLGGNQQNLTVAQIKEAAEYYRTRTLDINRALSKLNKEQERLNEDISRMRFRLTELNYDENQRSNQVIILLDADGPMTLNAALQYQVSDCGWAPAYDLVATDLNSPISLKYKAQVYNNTGNEWKDVQLTLSTADPRLSASKPMLSPWFLSYWNGQDQIAYAQKPGAYEYRAQAEREINIANQRSYDNYMLDKNDIGNQQYARNLTEWDALVQGKSTAVQQVAMKQIEVSELSADFPVAAPFSCPSDSKPYMVEIKQMSLPATFSHISVPKLEQSAYLQANIVGWQDLDLIPGPAHVYFAGNYVGMSTIETRNVSDTLSLSFGRDSKIQVSRKLKSEMTVRKTMGNTKKETYYYDITVRNNRSTPVKLTVYDQIPVSQNGEIIVSTENSSDGDRDNSTGEIKWELTLQPGESKTWELGYTVKYPKTAKVEMRTYKTISAPSF
jgi:uncharacterized protein (TIGR02231 family)